MKKTKEVTITIDDDISNVDDENESMLVPIRVLHEIRDAWLALVSLKQILLDSNNENFAEVERMICLISDKFPEEAIIDFPY